MLAVLPADRRVASAVRRFPPGCGRTRNAAAQKPPRPLPSPTTKPSFSNPSSLSAATTAALLPGGTVPAAASSGTVVTDRGAGDGMDAAVEVTVRRASARRRYPPGCGRGVAVAVLNPPALVVEGEGEAGAKKPPALVFEGEDDEAGARKPPEELCIEAKAKVCDKEALLCECAIDDGEFSSDSGMENGGDAGALEDDGDALEGGGDASAQEEGCGKPWVVTGLMAMPFLPWAQHGRRSQRLKADADAWIV